MKKLVMLFMGLLAILPAFAQSATAEELLLKQVTELSVPTAPSQALMSLQQLSGNVALVQQQGEANQVALQQYGAGNVWSLQQLGNGNSYEGTVAGTNILNDLYQIGNHNKLWQDIETNNRQYEVRQLGNGNELTQIEIGNNAQSYTVEQTGNARAVIVNGSR